MSSLYSQVRSKNHLTLEKQNKLLILLTYTFEVYLLKGIPIKNI